MEIKHAKYLGSWERTDQMPGHHIPEFAFIGRSNVGKSSLINMLCRHKGLAKTSSTPGKTQTINLFNLDDKLIFCDLPGYGYAKVSKQNRAKFGSMIRYYLKERENLANLFVLVDMRIPPQAVDIDFINRCGDDGVPFVIVGTKTDKLGPVKLQEQQDELKTELLKSWDELPPMIMTSAFEETGRKELLDYMKMCMESN